MTEGPVTGSETWTLAPDSEPDAAATTYAMKCSACQETSVCSEDFADPQGWVLAHSTQNPSHRTFHEVAVRSWRTGRYR